MNFDPAPFDLTPRQLFDAKRYGECLHATMQCYNVMRVPERTQDAIEDTGILHELVHLSLGIGTWTHRDMDDLRLLLPRVTADEWTNNND